GLADKCRPADVLTVFDALQADGQVQEAGGLAYLNSVVNAVPSSANDVRYAEIVRAQRIRRDVLTLGNEISALAAVANDPAELIERATGMAMSLADSRQAGQEPRAIGELLSGVLDALQTRVDRGGAVSGLATGFADLDDKTSGLQDGDLIIIAGRPSMG